MVLNQNRCYTVYTSEPMQPIWSTREIRLELNDRDQPISNLTIPLETAIFLVSKIQVYHHSLIIIISIQLDINFEIPAFLIVMPRWKLCVQTQKYIYIFPHYQLIMHASQMSKHLMVNHSWKTIHHRQESTTPYNTCKIKNFKLNFLQRISPRDPPFIPKIIRIFILHIFL